MHEECAQSMIGTWTFCLRSIYLLLFEVKYVVIFGAVLCSFACGAAIVRLCFFLLLFFGRKMMSQLARIPEIHCKRLNFRKSLEFEYMNVEIPSIFGGYLRRSRL